MSLDASLRVVWTDFPDFGGIGDILRADAKAYWKFDSSGNDATGRGNNLTNTNGVTFVAGKLSNAANFVSTSLQHFTMSSTADVSPNGTIAFLTWMFIANANDQMYLVSKDDPDYQYQCYFLQPEGLVFAYNGGGYVVSSTSPSNNAWHMVDFYYDAVTDTVGIAIDNGNYETSGSAGGPVSYSGSAFRIGRQSTAEQAGNYSNGKQDKTILLHRKFTQQERDYLYNGGIGRSVFP